MKWYGILTLLVLFGGLAGIVYLGANTEKLGFDFGEPSYISKQISDESSSYVQSNKSSEKACDQWRQELVEVRVKKSLTDSKYMEYPEFQSLMQKEFELDQKLLFRC